VARTLVRLSELVGDLPEVKEIEINPLVAGPSQAIALDARVRIAPARLPGTDRFAIRPYPRELESRAVAANGLSYALRPIRPEDRDALLRLVEKSSAEDLRLRFFAHLVALPPALASRLTQIDYDREMAWSVTPENGPPEFLAVGRLACDPDRRRAEFALLVRSDCKRQGLGRILMTRMIAYARNIGVQEIFGTAIRGNEAVIALCRAFGFVVAPSDMDDTVRLSLETASNSD
jgi:acetyltransferase